MLGAFLGVLLLDRCFEAVALLCLMLSGLFLWQDTYDASMVFLCPKSLLFSRRIVAVLVAGKQLGWILSVVMSFRSA